MYAQQCEIENSKSKCLNLEFLFSDVVSIWTGRCVLILLRTSFVWHSFVILKNYFKRFKTFVVFMLTMKLGCVQCEAAAVKHMRDKMTELNT